MIKGNSQQTNAGKCCFFIKKLVYVVENAKRGQENKVLLFFQVTMYQFRIMSIIVSLSEKVSQETGYQQEDEQDITEKGVPVGNEKMGVNKG